MLNADILGSLEDNYFNWRYDMENNKNTEKNTQNEPKPELPKVNITRTIREVFNYEKNKKK